MRNGDANEDLCGRARREGLGALDEGTLLGLLLQGQRQQRPGLPGLLLAEHGGLAGLARLEPCELQRTPGIGPVLACRLAGAFELGRRMWLPRPDRSRPLRHARDAAWHLRGTLLGKEHEEFHVLLLDARHRPFASRLVSVGSLQSSLVHPREVFRPAIRQAAAALVVGHNHPSGDPTPSEEDEAVTDRLREVGRVVGIPLVDHLVLGEREFHSFAEGKAFSW
ncbi:MAG: DNA repair protein RadC [Planctomycetota bacterium]